MKFFVASLPIAQPRQRQRAFQASTGRICVSNYTPTKHPVNSFKAAIQHEAKSLISQPIEGPIYLGLVFLMPRPKAMVWKTRPMPRVPHISKPDRDNLEKAVLDALTGIAWRDDSQVFDGTTMKVYAAGDELPGVEITIEPRV